MTTSVVNDPERFRVFGFGQTEDGEVVYIKASAITNDGVKQGDVFTAKLIPNDKPGSTTRWMIDRVISWVETDDEDDEDYVDPIDMIDDAIYKLQTARKILIDG